MAESMAMSCRWAGMTVMIIFSIWAVLFYCTDGIAAGEDDQLRMVTSGAQPKKDVNYYHLWASQDGETHFTKCTMSGFNLTAYRNVPFPQYLKSDFGGRPLKVVFSELPVGLAQPLHSPPEVQLVVTLSGSWYIKTSDGTRHEFRRGDVMFQDNTQTSPAVNRPEHYSGTVGDEPCHQLVVQLSRPPQVDNACPF